MPQNGNQSYAKSYARKLTDVQKCQFRQLCKLVRVRVCYYLVFLRGPEKAGVVGMKRKTVEKFTPGHGYSKVVFAADNPEWTEADFARAKYGADMPDAIKKAFKVARPKGR